ncbi:MAG TPA: FtsQ-type POTRA domain-containing protein [Myxococcaceae bacterium]|nr:FtsQ-type POTRA domain-containing protein [Myxococcaceae bacterium]
MSGVLVSRNRRRRADGAASRAPGGRTILRGLGLVALLASLGWVGVQLDGWAASSPRVALRTVRVQGLRRATEKELLRLAGVAPGMNLWSLDPAAVAQAMGAHPWVRTVEVTRSLPDTLQLRVEERSPVALASLGELYVVDAEGAPFKRLSPGEALDLPLLTGLSRETAERDPAATAVRLREALGVAEAYQRSFERPRLSEVHLGEAGFELVVADGVRVVLGREDLDGQLRRLQRVRDELQHRGLLAAAIHLENRVRPGWVAVQVHPGATAPSH